MGFLFILGIGIATPIAATEKNYSTEIEQCLDARLSGRANSITEYLCPSGDMIDGSSSKALSEVNTAYIVVSTHMMREIKTEAEKELKELATKRSTDAVAWTETIGMLFDPTREEALYPKQFSAICQTRAREAVIKWTADVDSSRVISTDSSITEYLSDAASECHSRTEGYLQALRNQGNMISAQAIVTTHENGLLTTMNGPSNSEELSGIK